MEGKAWLLGLAAATIVCAALVLALSGQRGPSTSGGGEFRWETDDRNGKQAGGPWPPQNASLELATLGGGCFWSMEALFSRLEGVADVMPGYSGGSEDDATYDRTSRGNTGHAEVVQVAFDPEIISYGEILEVFFHVHNPTTLNRQGADVGTQYRSVIFYHTEDQGVIAGDVIADVDQSGLWDSPIVTQVRPFEAFYDAEEYHQDYYENHQNQPYCMLVIDPKISKLEERFGDRLKE